MRVLLVAPPWLDVYGNFTAAAKLGCVSLPLGLMYLAGAVLDAGSECRIVDMESEETSAEGLVEIIRQYAPHLVGLTATTPVYKSARHLAQEIRKHFPSLPLALGGVHSTIVGRKVLEECPELDFQVCGEGEETLQEIIAAFEAGSSLEGIAGVIYRENGSVVENARRPLTEDLDSLPLPARQLVGRDLYQHSVPGKKFVPYANVFTSRGCPYRCIFCSQHTMHGRRMRWHSVERVVQELRYITEEMDVHHVVFMDETLTLNKERTLAICTAICDAGLEFTWEGWTHAATVDEEMLRAMKAAGFVRISFGIESGDPEILEKIKKDVTLEQIRRAYRIAAKVGVETRGSAMLGHPYETRETAWRTIRFIRSIRGCQQIFLNIACPYPGTELYEYASTGRGGMRLLSADYSRYTRYGDPVIEVNDLSASDLKRLQSLGLLYFYLTPRRIWHNMVRRCGPGVGLVNSLAFLRGVLSSMVAKKR